MADERAAEGREARDTRRERPLDLVCLGRAAVDLYGVELGAPLEDVSAFARTLGGSAANVAVGASRLGLAVAMLTRVGDEPMGTFVRRALEAEGVDTSRVRTDPDRLTGLVLLSVRDAHTFPLLFYRERCADMGLVAEDFDADFVQSARALLVTGTHFSEPGVDRASRTAIQYARAGGTKVVLDVDYRPVLWKLAGHGSRHDGYVASARVTEHILSIARDADLVVGTEEELHLAGGSDDTLTALRRIRDVTPAPLVLKRGHRGAVVFEGPIPAKVEDGAVVPGFEVDVLNVLGAGDAFLAGLLASWLGGQPLTTAARRGNACGALVVSRHGCAPAMPTKVELEAYLTRASAGAERDPEVARLHRLATRRETRAELAVLAFDHRTSLERLAARAGADVARLAPLKRLIADAARRGASRAGRGLAEPSARRAVRTGMIIDDTFGRAALDAATAEASGAEEPGPGIAWWLARPIERPPEPPGGDPATTLDLQSAAAWSATPLLDLAVGAGESLEHTLRKWPKRHVVKCLLYYHPDDAEAVLAHQETQLRRLAIATREEERELLVEILPVRGDHVDTQALPRTLARLYEAGVAPEWWKLPPPADTRTWVELSAVVEARDPDCRGVLLLGLDAPEAELARGFRLAADFELCRGFAVGRTIFGRPAEEWLKGQLNDEALVERVAARFERMIALWRGRRDGGTP